MSDVSPVAPAAAGAAAASSLLVTKRKRSNTVHTYDSRAKKYFDYAYHDDVFVCMYHMHAIHTNVYCTFCCCRFVCIYVYVVYIDVSVF